jgi:hypothetical protein
MATPKLKRAFLVKRMAEIRKAGSINAASKALGVASSTLQAQVRSARAMGLPDPREGLPQPRMGPPARPPMTESERRENLALKQEVARLSAP